MSSRAVQRKRKRQQKLGKKVGHLQMNDGKRKIISDTSSDEDKDDLEEDDDNIDEDDRPFRSHYEDDFDDEIDSRPIMQKPTFKKSKKSNIQDTKKQKLPEDDLFSVPILNSVYISHLESPIMEILQLEDVLDLPCDQKAALLLSKIIFPTDRTLFYQLFWERIPLHSARSIEKIDDSSAESFLGKLFTIKELKRILKEHVFVPQEDIHLYGKSFQSLQNERSIDGPAVLKTFLKSDVKCGIRLLETQKWSSALWQFASALEFEFQSRVSVDVVIQSPDFLGFDKDFAEVDYDQFVIQLEGSSGWEIAQAKSHVADHIIVEGEGDDDEENPTSSAGKTNSYFLATCDTLYIPKGRVFRQTSLHPQDMNIYLVLGTNRNRSVQNLMSLVVPQAIGNLAAESQRMRQALPLTLTQYTGVAASETETEENPLGDKRRHLFLQYIEKTIMPLIANQVLDIIDPAVDQISKTFIMERLPVPLSAREEKSTVAGFSDAVIFPYTQLRMLRPGIATVTIEDGKIVLYHCMDNSRSLFGNEISPLEFELDDGPAIEMLIKSYPQSIMVSDLPHPSEDLEDKVGIAQALYKEGFLVIVDETSKPGKSGTDVDDDEKSTSSLL